MGAVTVHMLAERILNLTSEGKEPGKDAATYSQLRQSLIDAYRELGEVSSKFAETKQQKHDAMP